MYSFGERQAVSKLQKRVLEYEISFWSAILLHIANQYSFGHKKSGQNIFGHPCNVKKLVNQEHGRDRSEYLRVHYLEWNYLTYAKCNDNYLCFNPPPHIIHRTCILHVCPTFA